MRQLFITCMFSLLSMAVFSQHTLFFYIPECPHQTGINDQEYAENQISIYPNPVKDVLSIKIDVEQESNNTFFAEIYDLQGKLLLSRTIDTNSFEFNLEEFNDGIYLVQIRTSQKLIGKKRFIKIK